MTDVHEPPGDAVTPARATSTGSDGISVIDPLPSGLLTVLFTDIEDSTRMWEQTPETMRTAMHQHDRILNEVVAAHHGRVFKHTGDGVGAVFASPNNAARAALDMQRRLQTADWNGGERIRVRIGMHLGDIEPTNGDYFGPPVNRAARVMDVANGDQITASGAVTMFLHEVRTRRMGPHQLKGIGTETIDLLVADDLLEDERPLRARVSRAVKPLPSPAHALIGRSDAIADCLDLVRVHQTVTVVGPGGVGKTHFAIETGRAARNDFADGAVLCELAPLADDSAVLDTIAESIGARLQPDMTLLESILDYLEEREMLIILDNCEHVIEAVNDFAEVVAPFTDVRVLATSRERLGLRSEQVFTLAPLDPAGAGSELFLERARERDLTFDPDPTTLAVIRRICERLDGIPLAVELAAAWVRVLSPDQLLERLEDRLDVLERTRNRSHRQTLRGTVQWSYDQLDPVQKQLFNRLSVFGGGFSLDAAVEVCADDDAVEPMQVLDVLMSLVDKSMVGSERGTGQIRFSMLSTLREFGHDQLVADGSAAVYAERHADHFLDFVRAETGKLVSAKEAEVWDLLDREWPNLRTAFATLSARPDRTDATTFVLDLGWFAGLSLRFELFAWAEELAAQPDLEQYAGAASLLGLVAMHRYFTIDERSVATANRGLELDPSDPYGYCRVALAADSLNNVHEPAEAAARTEAWLDSLTDDSPTMSRLWALGMRIFHICSHAPSPEAAERHAELQRLAVSSGSATAMALSQWAGGMVRSFEGIEHALDEWRKGIDSARSISDVHLLIHLLVGLELHFTARHGDLDRVVQRCLTILRQAHDQHYLAGTSHLFGVTAIILSRIDQAEVGAELLGSMRTHGHLPRGNALAAIERSLDADVAAAADRRGRELGTNEAAARATAALETAISVRTGVGTEGGT